MFISVQMSGRIWGGYPFSDAAISINYSNNPEINGDGNRTLRYGYFLASWVGKRASADLYIASQSEPLISKGEVFKHRHAEIFADQYPILFGQDGWFDYLVGCMRWCREKELEKLQAEGWEPDEIRITFNQQDTVDGKQPRSYIQINKEVAKWLGEALLDFVEQEVDPDYVAKLAVSHEPSLPKTAVVEPEPAVQPNTPIQEARPRVLVFPMDRLGKRSSRQIQ